MIWGGRRLIGNWRRDEDWNLEGIGFLGETDVGYLEEICTRDLRKRYRLEPWGKRNGFDV